ncbi:hypothetical protein AGIG_G5308 [Arapaima gigas]
MRSTASGGLNPPHLLETRTHSLKLSSSCALNLNCGRNTAGVVAEEQDQKSQLCPPCFVSGSGGQGVC